MEIHALRKLNSCCSAWCALRESCHPCDETVVLDLRHSAHHCSGKSQVFISSHNCGEQREFFGQIFNKNFYECQVNSRLVTILKLSIFLLFMNLVDDLTEYQITQTLTVTTARATGADKGNPTVCSHATLTGADKGNPTLQSSSGANK